MWPLWLLAACYIAVWVSFRYMHGSPIDISGIPAYTSHPLTRILTSLATLPVYVWLIVWPAHLHIGWRFPLFTTLLVWPPAIGLLMVINKFIAPDACV